MHESTRRAVTNKGYKEDKSISEKPMELKKSGGHAKEDKGHAKTEEDPCNLYENLECKKSSPPQGANRRFLWLTIIACLISMVALLLGLLLLSGKIGYGCSCSKNEGTKSLAKLRSSEENITSIIMDLFKNYETSFKQTKSTLDKTNGDLAELKISVTKLRELHSASYQVKATADKTRNDLAKLNSTVTTLSCINNPCKNGTWYPVEGECKFKCVCAVGFTGKLCDEVQPLIKIFIRSEGCDDPRKTPPCGVAYIKVDGTEYSPQDRGYNVVVLNGSTGSFLGAKAFDTYADGSAGNRLRDYLNNLSGNKIILVAVQDEGSNAMSPAIAALKRVGATEPVKPDFRGSFALAGYAGVNRSSWISQKSADRGKGPSELSLIILLPARNGI